MLRWHFSLPLPAAPTLPSRFHRSSSPIAADSPSRPPLMSSCSRSIAVHHRPSPCRPSPPSHHCVILIHPPRLRSQSSAVALVLSLTVHCHQRAIAPSITIKELLRHPLSSRRAVHHRRGAVHRCQSVYCFQVAVAPSIDVHCC